MYKMEVNLVSSALRRELFEPMWSDLISHRLITTVSGVRRIGKTYLLKQLMQALSEKKNTSPFQTLYFQFSTRMNEQGILGDLVALYEQKYAPELDYWQDQVKLLYDGNPRLKIVVTGSTSLFHRQKSRESLAGRVIKKKLSSLSFPEYLAFSGFKRALPRSRAEFIRALPVFRSEFVRYLFRGQFPELVINKTLSPGDYLQSLLDQVINFDIAYIHTTLNRTLFFNVFRSLSFSIANEYSVNRLAQDLNADRREVAEYINILEETGLFQTCLNGYFRKMRAKVSGAKKIYSLNTNLTLAANGFDERYLADRRVFGQYAENYVFLRLVSRGESIEYYREKGREIDFIIGKNVYEVKSGEPGDISPYREIAGKLKRELVLVTENRYGKDNGTFCVPWYVM